MKFSSTYFKRAGDIVPNKIKQIKKRTSSKLLAAVKTPQKKIPQISQSERQHLRATSLFEFNNLKQWNKNLQGDSRKYEKDRKKTTSINDTEQHLSGQKSDIQTPSKQSLQSLNSSKKIAELQRRLGLHSNYSINQNNEENHARVRSMQVFHKNTNSYIMSARVPFQYSGALSPQAIQLSRGKEENEQESAKSNLSIAQQCLICFGDRPDSVFMECGHGGVCYDCALEVWKATGECFLCRKKITQVLQVDLSYKNGNIIKVLSSTQMVVEEFS